MFGIPCIEIWFIKVKISCSLAQILAGIRILVEVVLRDKTKDWKEKSSHFRKFAAWIMPANFLWRLVTRLLPAWRSCDEVVARLLLKRQSYLAQACFWDLIVDTITKIFFLYLWFFHVLSFHINLGLLVFVLIYFNIVVILWSIHNRYVWMD